jgi:CO/xanthine dehydrogenase FAD-binding subunit
VKPPAFEYERPSTLDEALELLADQAVETRPLAGGQSLVPLMNFRLARPERLVDLNALPELAYVREDGGALRIGAMTRQAALERAPAATSWPLLAQALAHVGHPQIRNRGTVGGSVAHGDATAELPAASAALDARIHVRSVRGARTLSCEGLFLGPLMTTLEPDELLVEIELPPLPEHSGTAFVEFARRHGDFALAGAAVRITAGEDGVCSGAALVVLGDGSVARRARAAESVLSGSRLGADVLAEAAEAAVRDAAPSGDVHGGAAYRRDLLSTMVRRGLEQAAREVT